MHSIAFFIAWLFSLPLLAAQAPVGASALFGAVVVTPAGEQLGILRDLALAANDGIVAYAMVEYDDPGVLRAELRPVPVAELRPGLAPERLVLDPSAGAGASAKPDPDARLLRGSTVLGMAIEHPTGADYGTIVDLAVDLQNARVAHAVVRLDAAGDAAPLVEVPFSALRFPLGSGKALLTLAR